MRGPFTNLRKALALKKDVLVRRLKAALAAQRERKRDRKEVINLISDDEDENSPKRSRVDGGAGARLQDSSAATDLRASRWARLLNTRL